MELVLVRHAEPERIEDSDDGPADPPLTETGREHACRVGAWLTHEDIQHVVTSPLLRARQTARPLLEATDLEPEVIEGIGEFDARDPSYIPFEEIPRDHERFTAMVEGRWTDIPGWSDPQVFRRGVVDSLEAVIDRHPGGRVAVFTHAGTINVYLGRVLGIERLLWFYPGYTSISRVVAARGGPRSVLTVNETGHLQRERLERVNET